MLEKHGYRYYDTMAEVPYLFCMEDLVVAAVEPERLKWMSDQSSYVLAWHEATHPVNGNIVPQSWYHENFGVDSGALVPQHAFRDPEAEPQDSRRPAASHDGASRTPAGRLPLLEQSYSRGTMTQTKSLNELHNLLAHRPENGLDNLHITTERVQRQSRGTPSTSRAITSEGSAEFAHELLPIKLLTALLIHYPIPVTVDGQPVERIPAQHKPYVARFEHSSTPDGRLRETTLYGTMPKERVHPMVVIDGLTYILRKSSPTQTHFRTPGDRPSGMPWRNSHENFLIHQVAFTTSQANQGNYQFALVRNTPEVILNPRSTSHLNRILRSQKDQAATAAGYEHSWQELKDLPHYTNWIGHEIYPDPSVEPVTIHAPDGYYRRSYQWSFLDLAMSSNVAVHTLHHALDQDQTHNMLPVKPPVPNTRKAITDLRLTTVTLQYPDGTMFELDHKEQQAPPDLPPGPASAIELRVWIARPGREAEEMMMATDVALLGHYTAEQPVVTNDCTLHPAELTQILFNAYFHPKPGQPGYVTDDKHYCEHLEIDDQYRANMMTTAVALLQGPKAALEHEVRLHWEAFTPITPVPPSLSMDDIIRRTTTDTEPVHTTTTNENGIATD